jgi:hypothetical protein
VSASVAEVVPSPLLISTTPALMTIAATVIAARTGSEMRLPGPRSPGRGEDGDGGVGGGGPGGGIDSDIAGHTSRRTVWRALIP